MTIKDQILLRFFKKILKTKTIFTNDISEVKFVHTVTEFNIGNLIHFLRYENSNTYMYKIKGNAVSSYSLNAGGSISFV